MGLLTFSINVTLDGCVDHQEGVADDETHAFFTRLMDEGGAMLAGPRHLRDALESYWPAVALRRRGGPPGGGREWAVKLEAQSRSTWGVPRRERTFHGTQNSHHIADDLRTGVQKLKDATPDGVLLGSRQARNRAGPAGDLIDEYKLLVHPRIAGHGPTLYESGLPSTRRLELVSGRSRSATARSPCITGARADAETGHVANQRAAAPKRAPMTRRSLSRRKHSGS